MPAAAPASALAPSRTAPSPAPRALALPALALLGLALAVPPAHASPIDAAWSVVSRSGDGIVQCADDSCQPHVGVDPCDAVGAANACDLLRSVGAWCDGRGDCSVGDPTRDQDHDLLPDAVESGACGRAVVRHALAAQAGVPAARCRTWSDMGGLPDGDRDGIPDSFEPGLCAVEDSNSGLDGSCDSSGMDYRI